MARKPSYWHYSLVVLSLFVPLVNLGCKPQAAPGEIHLGLLTDIDTPEGPNTINAAMLAVQEANENEEVVIGGKKFNVVLLIEDAQDSPDVARDKARSLIYQQEVVALIGPNRSRNAAAVADVSEHARVPLISPGATNPDLTSNRNFVFRVAFTNPFQGQVLARFARYDINATTAAVLYDVANTYTKNLSTEFRDSYSRHGGELVAFERYTTGDRSFQGQLEVISSAEPDVLFLPNYTDDVLIQVEQAREVGIQAIILGSDGWSVNQITGNVSLDGAFFSQHWHESVSGEVELARHFLDEYRRAYDEEPHNMAALTYDATRLFIHAIQLAESAQPEAIRDQLSKVQNYRGVTGILTYDRNGDPQKSVVMLNMKDGHPILHKHIHPDTR